MKINKNIIKELTEYLNEFNLTEIEYTEKDVKVKVSKLSGTNIATAKEIKSEIKSENIKIGSIIPNAVVKGIEIVIKGIEISAIDPPKPDLAIPKKIIAGITVKKNKRFISIALMNLIILILED